MHKLKNDTYRKNRGGYARFLTIYCAKCQTPICLYQKDGPGPLKRTYLDRFIAPENLTNLQRQEKEKIPPELACPNCGNLLGKLYMYEKEPRLAYRMTPEKLTKKITKGLFPIAF